MRRLPDPRRRPAGGFTLLELVVAFAVAAVAIGIAAELLSEAQLRMAHSARRVLDPPAAVGLKQLRADVQAAGGFETADFDWVWGELALTGHPAGTVRYDKVGRDLVRSVSGGRRVVLRAVSTWRWRLSETAPLPLLEVEVGLLETPSFGRRGMEVPVERRYLVAAGPRQAGGRKGW